MLVNVGFFSIFFRIKKKLENITYQWTEVRVIQDVAIVIYDEWIAIHPKLKTDIIIEMINWEVT